MIKSLLRCDIMNSIQHGLFVVAQDLGPNILDVLEIGQDFFKER